MTVKFNSATKIVQSGSNMVFTDQNNPQGWTLTQLAQSGSQTGGGGGGTTIVTGSNAQGQAAYYGFVTSSVFWAATGSWTPFLFAMPDSQMTDVITQSISRTSSSFTVLNGGLYAFHANFNAYGSDAYISLRLNGVSSSKGIVLERSTYRTTPTDQNQVQLDGIFSASIGDVWTLEYVTSGTVFPWTGSNPLPNDGPMRTGEVSIFMLSPGFAGQPPPTLNVMTASLTTSISIPFQPTYIALADITSSFTDVEFWARATGLVAGGNTVWLKLQVDGVDWPQAQNFIEVVNNGAGFGGGIMGRVTGLSSGSHTFSFRATKGSNANSPTIDPTAGSILPGNTVATQGATLMIMNLTSSPGGPGPTPKAPIYTLPFLAGTTITNSAHSGSKQSLGMVLFNPTTVQGFGGSARRYFFRAIMDCITVETNLSAAIDINDYSGIVQFPPSTIPGSIMSTSSPSSVQLQVELTSLLQVVTGSGLFEARLWRSVSGSLASVANCRGARLDVELS